MAEAGLAGMGRHIRARLPVDILAPARDDFLRLPLLLLAGHCQGVGGAGDICMQRAARVGVLEGADGEAEAEVGEKDDWGCGTLSGMWVRRGRRR